MKKQGFTLIELMVVIVIMGVLAAVAVPKLFGMIAKSKASEVPTAAGSYINMQDAFAIEKDGIGNWAEIGYSAPGVKSDASNFASQNFEYTGADINSDTDTSKEDAWVAKAKNKLNDCASGATWNMDVTYNKQSVSSAKAGNVEYDDGGSDSDCLTLTPAWKNLFSNS